VPGEEKREGEGSESLASGEGVDVRETCFPPLVKVKLSSTLGHGRELVSTLRRRHCSLARKAGGKRARSSLFGLGRLSPCPRAWGFWWGTRVGNDLTSEVAAVSYGALNLRRPLSPTYFV